MRKFKQVKRNEIVFSLEEWSKIEHLAAEANLNTTEYIRRMALNKKVVQVNMPDITHVLNMMKSVANNLNQLAKKAHAINNIYTCYIITNAMDISYAFGGYILFCGKCKRQTLLSFHHKKRTFHHRKLHFFLNDAIMLKNGKGWLI